MQELGALRARLLLEAKQFKEGMQQARDEMKKTGDTATKASADMQKIQMASLAIGTAIAVGIGGSVKVAADFEQQMSRVKAISGATDGEFKKLQQSAMKLGASTSKSASEVAKGMEDMAAMGFNVNEIIAAMPGVISAAEAAGSDLATTAGIVASALNSFQMEASDANRVADILAMTANVSAASIDDMGYAFKYAAPIANSLGISIEEVAAAIGIMTNAGLEGGQAGTSLRQILLSLNNPAKEQEKIMEDLSFSIRDANGNAKSLSQIMTDLTKSTKDMTKADKLATIAKLVGTEAASGMIAILDGGVDQLDEFTDSLKNSTGASKEAADVMMDNLKGAYEEFTGALETAGIKVGNEFLPEFKKIVEVSTDIVNVLGDLNPDTVETGLKMAGTAAAIGLVGSSVFKLIGLLRTLSLSMGPAGWIIAGLSIIGGLLVGVKDKYDQLNEVNLDIVNGMIQQRNELSGMISEYDQLKSRTQLTADELGRFRDINSEINKTANPKVIEDLRKEQELLKEKSELSNDELNRLLELNDKMIEVVPDANVTLTDQGNILLDNTNAAKKYNREQLESIRLELEQQKIKAEGKMDDLLEKELDLKNDMNEALEEQSRLDEQIKEQQQKIIDLELLKQQLIDENNLAGARGIEASIEGSEKEIERLKDKKGVQADIVIEKHKELEKTQKELGKLDEIKLKMVEIELEQAGLNAKKGEGLNVVNNEIKRLEEQKRKLAENTTAQDRTNAEYRQAVNEIDKQLGKLYSVKQNIINITGEARKFQDVWSTPAYKNIYISKQERLFPGAVRHQGGPLPKFHTGGSPAFEIPPLHNEIDARLLRNEMVLTETQQAQLFRMLDSGFVAKDNSEPMENGRIEVLLGILIDEINILASRPVVLDIDGRSFARATVDHFDSELGRKRYRNSR